MDLRTMSGTTHKCLRSLPSQSWRTSWRRFAPPSAQACHVEDCQRRWRTGKEKGWLRMMRALRDCLRGSRKEISQGVTENGGPAADGMGTDKTDADADTDSRRESLDAICTRRAAIASCPKRGHVRPTRVVFPGESTVGAHQNKRMPFSTSPLISLSDDQHPPHVPAGHG